MNNQSPLSINELQARLDQINEKLIDPSLEQSERVSMQKEHARVQEFLEILLGIDRLEKSLKDAQALLQGTHDEEMKALCVVEVEDLEKALSRSRAHLEDLLYPPDPLDQRSAFVEIRAGAGGQEAALFASDLMTMYTNYSLKKGWQVDLVDSSQTDLKGFREVTLHIQGKGVYGHLKNESGVHRVQRVPATETQGRIHTSTATVAILPEADEVEFAINPSELRIDTYRAGGAGGQHVNKTDSAVRITHIPTGVVVACQDERSQHKNRNKAMKMLQSRLLAAHKEKQEAEVSKQRKEQVGTGMRAEKVRTYNYPQNRITDHQIELTLKKLDVIMTGQLDEILEPLQARDREMRRKKVVQ